MVVIVVWIDHDGQAIGIEVKEHMVGDRIFRNRVQEIGSWRALIITREKREREEKTSVHIVSQDWALTH